MLALTRKKGEALIVDGQIEIRVLDIQGDKVRIGINAPKEVGIHREEVYKLIQESNKEAASIEKTSIDSLQQMIDAMQNEN